MKKSINLYFINNNLDKEKLIEINTPTKISDFIKHPIIINSPYSNMEISEKILVLLPACAAVHGRRSGDGPAPAGHDGKHRGQRRFEK